MGSPREKGKDKKERERTRCSRRRGQQVHANGRNETHAGTERTDICGSIIMPYLGE